MNPVEMSARAKRIISQKSFLWKSSDRQERRQRQCEQFEEGN
jgi:hypothetical protein